MKKPLNFWQRLKVAKANRLKTESILKSQGTTFLRELLGTSSKLPQLRKLDRVFGYLHYEAGLSLLQISNDIATEERNTRTYNDVLLKTLDIKS